MVAHVGGELRQRHVLAVVLEQRRHEPVWVAAAVRAVLGQVSVLLLERLAGPHVVDVVAWASMSASASLVLKLCAPKV